MSGGARLRALRLVGFKSFAEATTVQFGPGISAVVGPNGSGKSNLADALRWTLGEQGRSLRTRRSEDVIFAGSSTRRAIGMADVTLVIDNGDRLLPLDYSEVEISRRLYRSGENEYLLNRQRVRLRDLVDVLDAGNLADNAFLFIGQGMVDQALALRPEERRPLFEEAAGVRRHERRRRHAEAELAEAETNLERLRDVLDELRPQVRRLAAQAEQLAARRTAGLELAEALVAAARARWTAAHGVAEHEEAVLADAHRESDTAMAALRAAEETIERHSTALAERARNDAARRAELEGHRGRTIELRLEQARLVGEIDAAERERRRLRSELGSLETRMSDARRLLAEPAAAVEPAGRMRLREAERNLDDLARQLSELRAGSGHGGATGLSERRHTLGTRLDEERHRQADAESALEQLRARGPRLAEADRRAREELADADGRLADALGVEESAEEALRVARVALERATAGRADVAGAIGASEAVLAAARARVAALEARLESAEDRSFARAARARGGSLVAEGLEIERLLRRAVAAALADGIRAVAVDRDTVTAMSEGRGGVLLVREAAERWPDAASERSAEALVAAAIAFGGDRLSAAVRHDPQGHISRLLGRTVWVPELAQALELSSALPAGWRIATLRGEMVSDDGLVRLAEPETSLELRPALEDERRAAEQHERELSRLHDELDEAERERSLAERRVQEARDAYAEGRRRARTADEAQRTASRRAEQAAREAGWYNVQLVRLETEAAVIRRTVAQLAAELDGLTEPPATSTVADQLAELEARIRAARQRRDELATEVATAEEAARKAETARQRAEITLALDEARVAEIEAAVARAAAQLHELRGAEERVAVALASAQDRERASQAALESLLREDAGDRAALSRAEQSASEARERLRRAESRSRTAEVAVMEARLQLESVREQLLVELAAIGADGVAALRRDDEAASQGVAVVDVETLGARLEHALNDAIGRWQLEGRSADEAPGSGRLALLRRRFHEVGAGNPFAAEEYEEVRARLEALEAQRADLEAAMANTRELIASLSRLITDQFLSTFHALEGAFGRRFEQLFGGGEAQLSLTQPEDLSATGVEITARPPGKKRQPLAMLSGGERALTAVALLLAMLEVRPVPFCVLDEVDAALDEANIARFSEALRGLADQTQFVVITHNRGTIEAADALYGVTLGEDAVSRIVSLRLPPADDTRPPRVIKVAVSEPAEAPLA